MFAWILFFMHHRLSFWRRGCMWHPYINPNDYMDQEILTLISVLCQKGQCIPLAFNFVLFCKHLQHPAFTKCSILQFLRHSFVKKWMWECGRGRESDIMVNYLFSLINCRQEIFIQQRQLSVPFITLHIFVFFVKKLHPHAANFSWFNVFHIQ